MHDTGPIRIKRVRISPMIIYQSLGQVKLVPEYSEVQNMPVYVRLYIQVDFLFVVCVFGLK